MVKLLDMYADALRISNRELKEYAVETPWGYVPILASQIEN